MINLPKTNSHISSIELIERKLWGKIQVVNTFSFFKFSKNSNVQNILHALKYKNKPELAEYIGKWYAQDLKNHKIAKTADIVMGVPMHKSKIKVRGYNQADQFAKGLADELGLIYDDKSMIKSKKTLSQTKTQNRSGRYRNTEGVFEVTQPDNIIGKNIILVDDLLTTGSTLEEAGKLLIEAGCNELHVVTIAAAY